MHGNSYGTAGVILSVIFERMIGKGWILLQKYCLFLQVFCVSKTLRSQQLAVGAFVLTAWVIAAL
jgi:hypothetical protein